VEIQLPKEEEPSMEKIFKIHQFLKKHELEAIKIESKSKYHYGRHVYKCKSCGMVFLDEYAGSPLTDINPLHYGEDAELQSVLRLIPRYSLETYKAMGHYGDIWWAGLTGDPNEEILHAHINDEWPHILLDYSLLLGEKPLITAKILGMPYENFKLEYCLVIKKPIPEVKANLDDPWHRKTWYNKIEKDIFESQINQLEIKRKELWATMKPAWKNTSLYNSAWYKGVEQEHKSIVEAIKKLHGEKMVCKNWAYNQATDSGQAACLSAEVVS